MSQPIVVHSLKGFPGVASASPFCLKLLTWLRMSELPHTVKQLAQPPSSSTGKVPYIEHADGSFLEDSERIIDVLTERHGVTLDADRTPEQRARALLLRHLAESHLYFLVLHSRWQDEDGWRVTKEAYFGDAPALVRPLVSRAIRSRVVRDLWGQGVGRERPAWHDARARESLAVLAHELGDQDWFSPTPGRLDAALHGLLANLHHWERQDALVRAYRAHDNLVRFVERVDATWWPPAG